MMPMEIKTKFLPIATNLWMLYYFMFQALVIKAKSTLHSKANAMQKQMF